MNTFDYAIVVGYLGVLLGLGYFFKEQNSKTDYFLGGREMGVFPLTLSTMATQLSAISFISAPAFVGLREGGGMVWLSYEFGVPLAMLFLMVYVLPALYRSGVVSIYDYLERRFGMSTRLVISVVFQVSRAFATGVTIYATALILDSVMGIPFYPAISIIGVITIIYSLQGGMKAVVWSDTIQMILIFFGVLMVGGYALVNLGGVDAFLANVDTQRLEVLRTDSLGFSGDEWGLLPMIFGGFVLYASYYGCDQTQAQRTLSAKSEQTVRHILLANGLARFPIVFLYCTAGLILGTFVTMTPEFMAKIPPDRPDTMVPLFIVNYLPHGIIGILVVALLAAAMSSLSSVVNSLSAVSLEDYLRLTGRELEQKTYVFWSRVTVFVWGIIIVVTSIFAGDIAPTVIEAINKIGSVFYGPILAIFLLAILFNKVHATGANIGLLTGVGVNVYLWLFQPQIFWLWWNFIGCVVTMTVALVISAIRHEESTAPPGLDQGVGHWYKGETIVLVGAFVGMLIVGALVPVIFGSGQ
ncbi:MAG: sodium/solute symporter [Woeseiaceae bacterium]|nr:sodium/solute symporter [Woeseiaceae bacterium]